MIQLWKYIEIRDIIFCLSAEQSETFVISVDTVMGNFALKKENRVVHSSITHIPQLEAAASWEGWRECQAKPLPKRSNLPFYFSSPVGGWSVGGHRRRDLLGDGAMGQTLRNNIILCSCNNPNSLTPLYLPKFLSSWELANSHRAGSLGK